jgi:tetratricopeptide (TPR) repeat protein
MARDPYEICPCGSGKKLKFCCLDIVDEMERITRLRQNSQPRVALQSLENLAQKHATNPWVVTTRAALMLDGRQFAEARDCVALLLEVDPKHALGLAIHAAASFASDGWDDSKLAIHRAFQRSANSHPEMTTGLALGVAGVMFSSGRFMAARQHLALAIRMAVEKDRQDIFLKLLEFESNGEVAYPLRSVQSLVSLDWEGDDGQTAHRAFRLHEIGCYGPAGRVYSRLLERHAESSELWKNIGLCRAWDGDEPGAIEALRSAVQFQEDAEAAVECETLVQLLELNRAEHVVELKQYAFTTDSISKLLSALQDHDRLHVPSEDHESETEYVARIEVLDRALSDESDVDSWSIDDVPNILADVLFFDRDTDDNPARAIVAGYDTDGFAEAVSAFETAAGELIEDRNELPTNDVVPAEIFPLQWRWCFPERASILQRRRLEQLKWQNILEHVWPELPLKAIGDTTPRAAAGDSEDNCSLRAAVYVLDTFCSRNAYALDLDQIYQSLGISGCEPLSVEENVSLTSCSAIQLHRLVVKDLTDEQLQCVLNRALLLHHGRFLYGVLREVLERPSLMDTVDLGRVYRTLSDLAGSRFDRDERLEWISAGLKWSAGQDNSFQQALSWKTQELVVRLEDPADPELPVLLKHLWDQYGGKVPELRPYLAQLVDRFQLPTPWDEPAIATVGGADDASGSGDLWTPESKSEDAEKSKLWLPGQE